MADKVYYLPVTAEFVRKVSNYERPDSIYVTFGGQTVLNVAIQLEDQFAKLGDAVTSAEVITYPVVVRAAFVLGGLGSGLARNEQELTALCNKAFATSPQLLVEKSMKAWKAVEYEVVRDCRDTSITACNMENLDALGIHTQDSIVVAPSQMLSHMAYNNQYALKSFSKEYPIFDVARICGIEHNP
ncbi:hypothetical protein CALVIDRAFT_603085 [Calocera viscosa TUFC12733]|uniref:Carbamoyl phosphate synthase ATP-binding domain-containing protein n=1 Tax=Calocera viscosa (strain TUFC12733) TaxID=1330018 RepID=A0A167G6U1_CALVF|nr:hypothetical protein CALVIDRAFT_603085 [Calocera viscosa TUFC12733]